MVTQTPWKSCLNWKVIVPIVLVALTAWWLFRNQLNIGTLFPLLFLLICPLSMVFMMKSMKHSNCHDEHKSTPPKNHSSDEVTK